MRTNPTKRSRRKRGLIILLRCERIAGGKGVARVDADAESLRVADAVEDRRQMLEPPTEPSALAGRVFQQHLGLEPACLSVSFVERADDLLEPGVLAGGGVGARMGDDVGDSELLGPL